MKAAGFNIQIKRELPPLRQDEDMVVQRRQPGAAVLRLFCRGLVGALLLAIPAAAAVEGVVINGTTGREQPGVEVTLIKLDQGMVPVGTTKSDPAGKFRFGVDAEPGAPMLLRGDFEGVNYNQMIPPGSRAADVRLTVYRSAPARDTAGAPEQRIILLEPSGGQMIVSEFYVYRNNAQPPVTYVDPKQGTLRFYLPPAAKGVVQVNATGPGGMPLKQTAEKTNEPDFYKVNFPIKPGETRLDITYLVPYHSPMEFEVHSAYDWLTTRVAAPSGVTLQGEGMEALPENPQIKASIFGLPEAKSYKMTISGEGRLSRGEEQGGEQNADSISISPAPINNKLWLVLGFAMGILALGFYALYNAGPGGAAEAAAQSAGKPQAMSMKNAGPSQQKSSRARSKRKA
jgi:hypothetical protein